MIYRYTLAWTPKTRSSLPTIKILDTKQQDKVKICTLQDDVFQSYIYDIKINPENPSIVYFSFCNLKNWFIGKINVSEEVPKLEIMNRYSFPSQPISFGLNYTCSKVFWIMTHEKENKFKNQLFEFDLDEQPDFSQEESPSFCLEFDQNSQFRLEQIKNDENPDATALISLR